MKKYFLFYWFVGLLFFSICTRAEELNHPAQKQLQQNVDLILNTVHNSELNEGQKIKQIEQYADKYLDYERLTALAVGLPWRQFSAQQKQDFIAAFKSMIVRLYAHSALLGANKAKISVSAKIINQNEQKVETFTNIISPNGKQIEVGYQMYLQDGIYRIYNIRVNGTSLVTLYRNQFNELIQKKGIDGAIAEISNKGLSNKNLIK